MDRHEWDARYGATDLVWSAGPNQFLVDEVSGLSPARALDVACGEGRNAIWLASEGWQVTGVDFSSVGVDKGRRIAEERGLEVTWVAADLAEWTPPAERFELIVAFYLQLAADQRRSVHRRMASGLAPGGTFLVVGHATDNLTHGYGGPQDPSVLFSADDVAEDLAGLQIVKADQVRRTVSTDDGERVALDALVRAVRA